jgi:DNA-binding CsgD family transcriptional regulator
MNAFSGNRHSGGRRAVAGGSVEALPDAARPDPFELSTRVLTIALALSLWLACGSFVLAVAEGLGPHPLRRLLIGTVLVGCIAAALWQRHALARVLRRRPWLVVLVAAGEMALVIADGLIGGPYGAVTLTSLGLAAVVANPGIVWLCVAVLDAGYAATALADSSLHELADSGELAAVLGALLGYPFAALVVLGLAMLFKRFVADADAVAQSIRDGAPALTPALERAVQVASGRSVAMLPAPSPFSQLTPSEIRTVEGLASGRRPKQLAFEWGVSLATVRAHIKHAKRKTGAATLPELAAMTTRPDWPRQGSDGA